MNGVFVTIFSEPTPRLAEFYGRLGIVLTEEKHGGGPRHLSAQIESVLEFYPRKEGAPPFFIGVETAEDRATLKAELIAQFGGSPGPRDGASFLALHDPSGNEVRLFAASASVAQGTVDGQE
jgi:hypothetical protein